MLIEIDYNILSHLSVKCVGRLMLASSTVIKNISESPVSIPEFLVVVLLLLLVFILPSLSFSVSVLLSSVSLPQRYVSMKGRPKASNRAEKNGRCLW